MGFFVKKVVDFYFNAFIISIKSKTKFKILYIFTILLSREAEGQALWCPATNHLSIRCQFLQT